MKTICYVPLLLLSLAAYAQPRLAYNGGFEVVKRENSFQYWKTTPGKGTYTFNLDPATRRNGRYALRLEGQPAARTTNAQPENGFFHLLVPAELLAGKKKATVEAWVRTDGPLPVAGVWLNQFSPGKSSVNEKFTDTTSKAGGWQRLHLEVTLVAGAKETYLGGQLKGKGKVWFDDFALSLDGEPVADAATPARAPTPAEVAWINQAAVPLLGVDPQRENRDLDALSGWMGDARVVAVGEPTHGTGEVFRLRLRLLQYLVEKKGFNTFMLEDNLAEVGLMNHYVLTGSDTALRVLTKHFFPVWKNREMLALIEWMRQYNRQHGPKLQFRGMDMQLPGVATQNLERFARQYDPQLLGYVDSLARMAARFKGNADKNRSARKDSLIGLTRRLRSYVDGHRAAYGAKVPQDSIHWLALNADVVAQYYPNADWEQGAAYRDSCMAANIISYCRQYPEAKLLIWAHNSHVSRAPGWMGNRLDNHFGKDYFPVAFATATGTYTASVDFRKTAWKAFPLEEPYVGTVEYYLQQAKPTNYLLPLPRAAASPRAANWTGSEQGFRSIGFMTLSDQFSPANLRNEFEAIIFMKQTTHSKSYLLQKE